MTQKPPAAVVKYMRETREEVDLDVARYINRSVAAYGQLPRRDITVDGYIAIKLHCTPFQASRAITWARSRVSPPGVE